LLKNAHFVLCEPVNIEAVNHQLGHQCSAGSRRGTDNVYPFTHLNTQARIGVGLPVSQQPSHRFQRLARAKHQEATPICPGGGFVLQFSCLLLGRSGVGVMITGGVTR